MKKKYYVMAVAAIFTLATATSCSSKEKGNKQVDATEAEVDEDEDDGENEEETVEVDHFYRSPDMALFDLYGKVQSVVYSEKNRPDVTMRFDGDAYLISMTRIADGKPEVAVVERDAVGRITEIQWYSDDPWVTMFDYGQDIMPRPEQYISTNRTGNSITYAFTRDDDGRITHTKRTEVVHFGEVEGGPAVHISFADADSHDNWLRCTIDEEDYGKTVVTRSIKYCTDSEKLKSALDKEQKKVKAFITDMYDNYKYGDEEFLEEHCTARLLNQLREAYDYDGEGYAFWLFRTSSTDGLGDGTRVVSVSTDDGLWYEYEFYDGSWKGKNRVKCVVVDGKVWMDEVERLYDEASGE